MIMTQGKDGFTYQSLDGNGMDNGNMNVLQDKLIHFALPDDIYVDLGAHIGTMSIPVIKATKPKLAILVEANPDVFPLLQENVRINLPDQNVRVVHAAICDHDGETPFSMLIEKSDSSSMVRPDIVRGGRSVVVPAMTVDTLLKDTEGDVFMKVDIECAETLMWQGINDSAKRIRGMIMEWFQNAITEEEGHALWKIINDKGFQIFTLLGVPWQEDKLVASHKEDVRVINTSR